VIDDLKVGEVRQSFDALGAFVGIVVSHRGVMLDRLLDEVHAVLLAAVVSARLHAQKASLVTSIRPIAGSSTPTRLA